jgi:hypothetical protein
MGDFAFSLLFTIVWWREKAKADDNRSGFEYVRRAANV